MALPITLEAAIRTLLQTIMSALPEPERSGHDPEQLLCPNTAARLLGVSTSQIREMAKSNMIPYVELPSNSNGVRKMIRFRRGTLEKWINTHEIKG